MEQSSKKTTELDLAPLSLAQEHARCASAATKTNNVPLARDQHVLAAGEFAKAAESAANLEALRTLKLLEDHHKHMSKLIKDLPTPNTALEVIAEKESNTTATKVDEKPAEITAPSPRRSPSKPTSQPRRPPSRELSSSIASNLATARGIRASHARLPVSPSISTQHVPGSFDQPMRRDRHGNRIPYAPTAAPPSGKPIWVPPASGDDVPLKAESGASPYGKRREKTADDVVPKGKSTSNVGFEAFYSMAEGFMNKLSAPLAYAGLPLNGIAEAASPEPEPEPKSDSSSRKRADTSSGTPKTAQTKDLDLSKFISKAALRASGGGKDLVNDSFYVVPSSGMTISYAGIINFDAKEKRREGEYRGGGGVEGGGASSSKATTIISNEEAEDAEEDDDFVDARESLSSPSLQRINSNNNNNNNNSAQSSLTNNMRKRFSRSSSRPQENNNNNDSKAATTTTTKESGRSRGKNEHILIEELEIKNTELRRVVDALTKRLHVFESSAQRSSLALHESIRFLGGGAAAAGNSPSSPGASVLSASGIVGGGGGAGNGGNGVSGERGDRTVVEDVVDAIRLKEMEARIRELEGEREGLVVEVGRERRERERLGETVRKYREKWEVLKKGAKERRAGTGGSEGGKAPTGSEAIKDDKSGDGHGVGAITATIPSSSSPNANSNSNSKDKDKDSKEREREREPDVIPGGRFIAG